MYIKAVRQSDKRLLKQKNKRESSSTKDNKD